MNSAGGPAGAEGGGAAGGDGDGSVNNASNPGVTEAGTEHRGADVEAAAAHFGVSFMDLPVQDGTTRRPATGGAPPALPSALKGGRATRASAGGDAAAPHATVAAQMNMAYDLRDPPAADGAVAAHSVATLRNLVAQRVNPNQLEHRAEPRPCWRAVYRTTDCVNQLMLMKAVDETGVLAPLPKQIVFRVSGHLMRRLKTLEVYKPDADMVLDLVVEALRLIANSTVDDEAAALALAALKEDPYISFSGLRDEDGRKPAGSALTYTVALLADQPEIAVGRKRYDLVIPALASGSLQITDCGSISYYGDLGLMKRETCLLRALVAAAGYRGSQVHEHDVYTSFLREARAAVAASGGVRRRMPKRAALTQLDVHDLESDDHQLDLYMLHRLPVTLGRHDIALISANSYTRTIDRVVLLQSAAPTGAPLLALVVMAKHAYAVVDDALDTRDKVEGLMKDMLAAGVPAGQLETLVRGSVGDVDRQPSAVEFCDQCRQPSASIAAPEAAPRADMGGAGAERPQAATPPLIFGQGWSRLGEKLAETEATATELVTDLAAREEATKAAERIAETVEREAFSRRPSAPPRAGGGGQALTTATRARLTAASAWSDRAEQGRLAVQQELNRSDQRSAAGSAASPRQDDERRREALRIMHAPDQPWHDPTPPLAEEPLPGVHDQTARQAAALQYVIELLLAAPEKCSEEWLNHLSVGFTILALAHDHISHAVNAYRDARSRIPCLAQPMTTPELLSELKPVLADCELKLPMVVAKQGVRVPFTGERRPVWSNIAQGTDEAVDLMRADAYKMVLRGQLMPLATADTVGLLGSDGEETAKEFSALVERDNLHMSPHFGIGKNDAATGKPKPGKVRQISHNSKATATSEGVLESVNSGTDAEGVPPAALPQARHFARKIIFAKLEAPEARIGLGARDVNGAFHRTRLDSRDVALFATRFTEYLIFVYLVLTMGWRGSPGFYSALVTHPVDVFHGRHRPVNPEVHGSTFRSITFVDDSLVAHADVGLGLYLSQCCLCYAITRAAGEGAWNTDKDLPDDFDTLLLAIGFYFDSEREEISATPARLIKAYRILSDPVFATGNYLITLHAVQVLYGNLRFLATTCRSMLSVISVIRWFMVTADSATADSTDAYAEPTGSPALKQHKYEQLWLAREFCLVGHSCRGGGVAAGRRPE